MIWIWLRDIKACEGGELGAIVARATRSSVGVMVKVHDGERADPNRDQGFELITALREARVRVRSWGYCYPHADLRIQAEFARASLAAGAERYIVDAEIEWQGESAQAVAFAALLPPGSGYSPLPIVDLHRPYPYAEFNGLGLALPQAYAGTGGLGATEAFNWSEDNWRRWSDIWAAQGARTPSIEWAISAADQAPEDLRAALALALDRARFGCGEASIWSWQHLTAQHWALIAEFTHLGEAEATESLQRVEGHLIAPFARAGSILHLANPTKDPIVVEIVKDGAGANVFARNLQVAAFARCAVMVTSDAAPLFVEDGRAVLVGTLEAPARG